MLLSNYSDNKLIKRVIQLLLIIFLITICLVFFKTYLANEKVVKTNNKTETIRYQTESNNIVRDLAYEVNIDKDRKYLITSKISEINNETEYELIKMGNVVARFTNKDLKEVLIKSDKAIYNNYNNNTNFSGNVEINYNSNLILSQKIDLDFQKKQILIHGDVKLIGNNINMSTDNIKIDLLKNELEVFMNDDKKVKFIVNKK